MAAGDFFADNPNRNLGLDGKAPLEKQVLWLKEQVKVLPEGVTVSVGAAKEGEVDLKAGPLHIFSLGMVDVSRDGVGVSQTVGAGGVVGVFYTISHMAQETTHFAGFFLEASGKSSSIAYFTALNITEALHGSVALHQGFLATARSGAFEISHEVHPVQEVYKVFEQVLGPLTDYRNFQDPLYRDYGF
ncbi:hypothetical protein CIT26_31970 [Mesorhizobium temperatum]|uniref:Uncharacterized protein n=1 Tax=Mesorhizobium temperatum TaxID=241416 RepID=A0A271LC74_9HYPH|nr:hypothetical protein CIT26_31970 [Mesorhizobium temperatum]